MAISDSLVLTEDQRVLRDTVRGLLADQLPSDSLRAMIGAEPGYGPELHARLAAELGLAGLTVPEEFGGRGLSQADAGVVHTELGHALYPGPFLPSGLTAGVLLAATGGGAADGPMTADGAAAAKRWLPLLAGGSVTGRSRRPAGTAAGRRDRPGSTPT